MLLAKDLDFQSCGKWLLVWIEFRTGSGIFNSWYLAELEEDGDIKVALVWRLPTIYWARRVKQCVMKSASLTYRWWYQFKLISNHRKDDQRKWRSSSRDAAVGLSCRMPRQSAQTYGIRGKRYIALKLGPRKSFRGYAASCRPPNAGTEADVDRTLNLAFGFPGSILPYLFSSLILLFHYLVISYELFNAGYDRESGLPMSDCRRTISIVWFARLPMYRCQSFVPRKVKTNSNSWR